MALEVAELIPRERNIVGPVGIDPEVLADFDVVLDDPFDEGRSSEAFRLGDFVLKVTKKDKPYLAADHLAMTMAGEHHAEAQFLGNEHGNMPATTLWVAGVGDDHNRRNRVCILQPFVEGVTLKEHARDPETSNDQVIDFLQRCLLMYEGTGKIPDLGGPEYLFNTMLNGNVVIEASGNPVLVDTAFGKLQRHPHTAPAISRQIANGVRRTIPKLR